MIGHTLFLLGVNGSIMDGICHSYKKNVNLRIFMGNTYGIKLLGKLLRREF